MAFLGGSATGVDRRRFLQGAAVTGVAGALAGSGATLANAAPALAADPATPTGGTHREFWVQAESFKHNLVPNGRDGMMGMTYRASETTYWAIGYRAYSANFGKPLVGNADIGPNTGIPGPVFRLNVGDTVTVHFRNADAHYKWPHSIHPHGVRYTPASDGAWLAVDASKPGTAVKYGQTYTYTWTVAPSSVGTWPYHDHSMPKALEAGDMPTGEVGALLGLFGMIIVEDPQAPKADVENLVFFHDVYVPTFSQQFNCINGQAFLDNTPTFTAKVGQLVRWRVAALGDNFHMFHVHGHRWYLNGRWDDTTTIGPAGTLTLDVQEDNPGDWLYHCHVTMHMMGGMIGRYRVST